MALVEGIPGEFGPQPWGEAILRNCGVLLLKITRRPADHEIRLPGLATTPRHVVEEQTGKALTCAATATTSWSGCQSGPLLRRSRSSRSRCRASSGSSRRTRPPPTRRRLGPRSGGSVASDLPPGRPPYGGCRRPPDRAGRGRHAADRGTRAGQRVPGAGRRTRVRRTGGRVVGQVIGPFPVRAGQVVRLSVAGLVVTRALVAPVGTVLASVHSKHGDLEVQVTNFGRTAARGSIRVPAPAGWRGTEDAWDFEGLAPGATIGRKLRLEREEGAAPLVVQLDAGRRSASLPWSTLLVKTGQNVAPGKLFLSIVGDRSPPDSHRPDEEFPCSAPPAACLPQASCSPVRRSRPPPRPPRLHRPPPPPYRLRPYRRRLVDSCHRLLDRGETEERDPRRPARHHRNPFPTREIDRSSGIASHPVAPKHKVANDPVPARRARCSSATTA